MDTNHNEGTNTTMNIAPLSGLILPALWWGYLLIGRPRK